METEEAYKLGIFRMITCLDENLQNNMKSIDDDILFSKKINLKEQIVDLSIKN